MDFREFEEIVSFYKATFGLTFNYRALSQINKEREEIAELLIQALKGQRGKVTNKDLGIPELPEGADY